MRSLQPYFNDIFCILYDDLIHLLIVYERTCINYSDKLWPSMAIIVLILYLILEKGHEALQYFNEDIKIWNDK